MTVKDRKNLSKLLVWFHHYRVWCSDLVTQLHHALTCRNVCSANPGMNWPCARHIFVNSKRLFGWFHRSHVGNVGGVDQLTRGLNIPKSSCRLLTDHYTRIPVAKGTHTVGVQTRGSPIRRWHSLDMWILYGPTRRFDFIKRYTLCLLSKWQIPGWICRLCMWI